MFQDTILSELCDQHGMIGDAPIATIYIFITLVIYENEPPCDIRSYKLAELVQTPCTDKDDRAVNNRNGAIKRNKM
jgi:hypothetical protein